MILTAAYAIEKLGKSNILICYWKICYWKTWYEQHFDTLLKNLIRATFWYAIEKLGKSNILIRWAGQRCFCF